MTDLRLDVNGAVSLEAQWDVPTVVRGAVVFCHPHPQHRGTMRAPLMQDVTRNLLEHDFAVLRFNFRGVGASTGTWSGGTGEMDDVARAVTEAGSRFPDVPLGLAGWSFGAATALRWQARDSRAITYVGIAPPVAIELTPPLPRPDELPAARRSFVIGDRDQFTGVDELRAYADSIGAVLHVIEGSDHFFYFREERVADLVAAGLAPEPEAGGSGDRVESEQASGVVVEQSLEEGAGEAEPIPRTDDHVGF